MTHELAKTLTTALMQFIDRERPEGSIDCSSAECERIEKAFEGGRYDVVESFIQKNLEAPLTPFQQCLNGILRKVYFAEAPKPTAFIIKCIQDNTKELLELAKKQLLSYADESNPKIEAVVMADLERTYFCNPDKLPKWLKDDIARKELNAHTKGYNKGYEDAEKRYNESVAYHYPIMPTPPSGWGCDGTFCTNPHHDCINCPRQFSSGGTITSPNTASGTSTLKAEG